MRDVNETRQARSKRCLVVDDSRVIRKVSSKIAKSLGYSVPTIKKDLQHLMKLLGTHDRRSTAGRAREIGLL